MLHTSLCLCFTATFLLMGIGHYGCGQDSDSLRREVRAPDIFWYSDQDNSNKLYYVDFKIVLDVHTLKRLFPKYFKKTRHQYIL